MLRKYMIEGVVEAGCDEAGRGPLAGSVFAAAVVLRPEQLREDDGWWSALNDSKQLTERQRDELRPLIEENALAWAVVEVTAQEIDEINILQASITGMQRALDKVNAILREQGQNGVEHVLADGNKWRPYIAEGAIMQTPADTVVHGDATYMSIAAASVLAKTYRDAYMRKLDEQYPQYGWAHNMGYPTAEHYAALRQYGPTPYHRMTFNLKLDPRTTHG